VKRIWLLETDNSGSFHVIGPRDEVVVIRGTFQWTALTAVVGILGICCRWLIHRRAWNPHSLSDENEAMRRHVNRNYDWEAELVRRAASTDIVYSKLHDVR
jgi:hypothetical protein